MVVRVAANNNFNCTHAEFQQLDEYRTRYPTYIFFVNSNIKTPKLLNLNKHDYPAVITVNPDLVIDRKLIARLKDVKPIAFLRLKWLPDDPAIEELGNELATKYPVVVTVQRFNSWASLSKYTDRKHYKLDCARLRLHGPALEHLQHWTDDHIQSGRQVFICDRASLGCQVCGLCSRLVTSSSDEVKSLNLSSSGVCPYHCVDCYAKTNSNRVPHGSRPIDFDHIHKNQKQAGKTKHIELARKFLCPSK